MTRSDRLTITAAVLVCFATSVSAQQLPALESSTVQPQRSSVPIADVQPIAGRPLAAYAPGSHAAAFRFNAAADAFAPQVYRDRPIRYTRDVSLTAMIIGAGAAITGVSLLVYANRPECESRPYLVACGYGTKVIGGAVLSGGLISLTIGALTW